MIFHRQINGKSSGIYCAYSQAVRLVDAYQGRIARKTSIKFKKHLTYIKDCGIVESDDHETVSRNEGEPVEGGNHRKEQCRSQGAGRQKPET